MSLTTFHYVFSSKTDEWTKASLLIKIKLKFPFLFIPSDRIPDFSSLSQTKNLYRVSFPQECRTEFLSPNPLN